MLTDISHKSWFANVELIESPLQPDIEHNSSIKKLGFTVASLMRVLLQVCGNFVA